MLTRWQDELKKIVEESVSGFFAGRVRSVAEKMVLLANEPDENKIASDVYFALMSLGRISSGRTIMIFCGAMNDGCNSASVATRIMGEFMLGEFGRHGKGLAARP